MARFKVGFHFYQQHTTLADLRMAWQEADRMGGDRMGAGPPFDLEPLQALIDAANR